MGAPGRIAKRANHTCRNPDKGRTAGQGARIAPRHRPGLGPRGGLFLGL
jgi:hypothetical protein